MSRPSSNESQVTRPRRRGAESASPATQSSPASEAPVLLRLPDLTNQLLAEAEHQDGQFAQPVAPPVTQPGVEPIAQAFATTSVGLELSSDPVVQTIGETELATEQAPDDDERGSSEIRERRRKRRQRQEEAGPPIWSTTSGRVSIASGVVLLGLLAAIVLAPKGEETESDGWDTSTAVEAGDFVQVEGPAVEATPWEGTASTPASTLPEPEPNALASQTEITSPQVTAGGLAPVQTSYVDPNEVIAQSTYAQSQDDAYATQPANVDTAPAKDYSTQPATHLQAAQEPYVTESTEKYAAPEASPGTYVPSAPHVASTPGTASSAPSSSAGATRWDAPSNEGGQPAAAYTAQRPNTSYDNPRPSTNSPYVATPYTATPSNTTPSNTTPPATAPYATTPYTNAPPNVPPAESRYATESNTPYGGSPGAAYQAPYRTPNGQ